MASPRPARTPALTSAASTAALFAAQAEASAMGIPVTVAVLDEGGAIKLLSRMDGAALISIQQATSTQFAQLLVPYASRPHARVRARPSRASCTIPAATHPARGNLMAEPSSMRGPAGVRFSASWTRYPLG